MKNFNPTNYPDYMADMDCTKPHSKQPKRCHCGKPYKCKESQKKPNHTIDLTGKAARII